jgi:hypothetical protein
VSLILLQKQIHNLLRKKIFLRQKNLITYTKKESGK